MTTTITVQLSRELTQNPMALVAYMAGHTRSGEVRIDTCVETSAPFRSCSWPNESATTPGQDDRPWWQITYEEVGA